MLLALCCLQTCAAYMPAMAPSTGAQCGRASAPVMAITRRQCAIALGVTLSSRAALADGAPLWISGKSDPIRKTSKDKPDGTKKDNRYLGCLNDCKPRKQGPPGPNQLESLDALEACQQECCTTYEQCTYSWHRGLEPLARPISRCTCELRPDRSARRIGSRVAAIRKM